MLVIPAIFLVALVVGFVLGGRIRNLERLQVHWWGLAFTGVVLQFVPVPTVGDVSPRLVGTAMLIGSYIALLILLTVNRWLPAVGVMTVGLVMNLAVVAANAGMPVQPAAITAAGGSIGSLTTGSAKHHLMTDQDLLPFLGDVVPIPPPGRIVISYGDVLLYGGIAWMIVQVMRGRTRENPRPLAMWFPAYRGKHAPSHWRMPARYRTEDHAGADPSGTAP